MDFKLELKHLKGIILNPYETLTYKGTMSYTMRHMWILFFLVPVPLDILKSVYKVMESGEAFSYTVIMSFVGTILMYIMMVYFFTPGIFYLLAKFIGKIDIVFDDLRDSMLPILLIQFTISNLLGLFIDNLTIIRMLMLLVINLWMYFVTAILLSEKYGATKSVVIRILTIPVVFYIALVFYDYYVSIAVSNAIG